MGKKAGKQDEANDRGNSRGEGPHLRTTGKETFLSNVESSLVNYLKSLGALPKPSLSKEDPLTQMLQSYSKKWRGVK